MRSTRGWKFKTAAWRNYGFYCCIPPTHSESRSINFSFAVENRILTVQRVERKNYSARFAAYANRTRIMLLRARVKKMKKKKHKCIKSHSYTNQRKRAGKLFRPTAWRQNGFCATVGPVGEEELLRGKREMLAGRRRRENGKKKKSFETGITSYSVCKTQKSDTAWTACFFLLYLNTLAIFFFSFCATVTGLAVSNHIPE